MLRYKDEKHRRETLTTSNILRLSQIHVRKIPNKQRLMNIPEKELSEVPWLFALKTSENTLSYEPVEEIQPNQAKVIDRISENQLTEKQEDSVEKYTPDTFLAELEKKTFEAKYKSIPFVDKKYWEIVEKNQYSFTKDIPTLAFIHVNSFKIDGKSGVGNSSAVQIYSYFGDSPTSEPIRIDFSSQPPSCTTFGNNNTGKDFYIPYVRSKKSTLVAILFTLEEIEGEIIEKPIALGHQQIACIENGSNITFNWVIFSSTVPVKDHFKSEKKFPMFNLVLEGEKEVEIIDDSVISKLNVKTTAFHPLYPSPMLTLYDTKLKIKFDSNIKGGQVYCVFSLKTIEENPTTPCVAAKPSDTKLRETFKTSTLTQNAQTCIPETINFKLNTRCDMPLCVNIEVYSVEGKKTKILFDAQVPLEEAQGEVKEKLKGHGIFGSGTGSISFSYIFPCVVAPPNSLMLSLISPPKAPDYSKPQEATPAPQTTQQQQQATQQSIKIPDFQHPMFQDVAPYILQYCLDKDIIRSVDFRGFTEIIQKCKSDWLYRWIEHQFTCAPSFAKIYIECLTKHISDIEQKPLPHFLILIKSLIAANDACAEEIRGLLIKAADQSIPMKIKKACGHFLKIYRMYFPADITQKHANVFIKILKPSERAEVFDILFSDPAFIQSTIPQFRPSTKNTYSPYCPLFSLFFSTVQESFLANNMTAIAPIITTIGVFGATLESYIEESGARELAFYLFPLLALIFTFLDSLTPHIGGDPSLVPFLLFIFQNCDNQQFISYYNLLSDYSQLRFLDFLSSLSDTTTINQLKGRILGIEDNELSIAHEVTWRLLLFLQFIEKIPTLQEKPLTSVINILIHMTSPQQDSDAFPMVFAQFAFIVKKFTKNIFIDETPHILAIISAVVDVTQRKLAAARITAKGFLRWIVALELSVHTFSKTPQRCNNSLYMALVKSLFENEDFNFSAAEINRHFASIDKQISKLKDAWLNGKVYLQRTSEMINILEKIPIYGCKYFIYKKVVQINEDNDDYMAAFVTQWRICALIADVFKLKKEVVDGIPTEGAKTFLSLFDHTGEKASEEKQEKKNSATDIPDIYLNLEGEMFTEESIDNEMQRALELCQKANMHWLAGSVTSFLLKYLEAHRKFDDLQNIFHKISESYTELAQNDVPKIDFYLAMYRGEIAKDFKQKNYIHVMPQAKEGKNYLSEYKEILAKAYPGLVDVPIEDGFLLSGSKFEAKSFIQMVKVNYDQDQLASLKARTFSYDIVQEEKDWTDEYVIRYTIEAETPLPGLLSCSGIKTPKFVRLTRFKYYEEAIKKTSAQIEARVNEFRAVMPPEKLKQLWTKWSLGLNTNFLIQILNDTIGENPKNAALAFVKKCKAYEANDEELGIKDLKDTLKTLLIKDADDIWKQLIAAVEVIDDIYLLNNRDRVKDLKQKIHGDPAVDQFRQILCPKPIIISENV